MPNDHTPQLTSWELAEAEAESDLIDADLEGCGSQEIAPAFAAPQETPAGSTTVSEAELAHAECESDLSHAEPAR